jgi:hypothetical protein
MNGYHTYYKFENESRKSYNEEYGAIDILAQLASILFWKKNYGPIKLYANTEYLDTIKKYGIEKEYDSINTELLDSIPFNDKASKFWSFSKIHTAKEISKHDKEFCIIDTDLWLKEPGLLNTDSDFLAFHDEYFDINNGFNCYYEPANWMEDDEVAKFDWSCLPLNCAIMYFKNRTQELIDIWYDEVIKVITLDKNPETKGNTIFIEQRLLPTIAKKLGISYDTIKPNTFRVDSFKDNIEWNKRWDPVLNSSDESLRIEHSITHIWIDKTKYKDDRIRKDILSKIITDIRDSQQFPGIGIKYKKLFDDCTNILFK